MNAETKKKIEDGCPNDLHFRPECDSMGWKCGAHKSWQEGAEFGYNLALEQANEILVMALESIKAPDMSGVDGMIIVDMGLQHFTSLSAKRALEAWKKLTQGEK